MQAPALDKPLHLEVDAGIDEAVEIPAGVLEGERVGIDQKLCDLQMDFCRQAEERSPRLVFACHVCFRSGPAADVGAASRDGGAHGGRVGGRRRKNILRDYCSVKKDD